MFNGGSTQREITRVLKISLCGVQNILKKFKSHKTLENLPKSGRPRKLTKAAARYIVLKSKSNPTFTARMVMTRCGVSHLVKIDTVKRILRRARLYGRIAIKKPFLTKKHRQSRLRWCKERAGWNAINWGRVIFSDESKIELFPQRRIYVRRNPGKDLSPSMINSTRKFSQSIMIWEAIRNDGRKILYRCCSISD